MDAPKVRCWEKILNIATQLVTRKVEHPYLDSDGGADSEIKQNINSDPNKPILIKLTTIIKYAVNFVN